MRKNTVVLDIGKTNTKLALVNNHDWKELAVLKHANSIVRTPPYPHYDIDGLWRFALEGLARFQESHGIDAIAVTTHGASAVLLDEYGELAAPVLDYEHDGPDQLAVDYDAVRPPFVETGSPRLPLGLNLGAQLFWQFGTVAGLYERTRTILTYPQYWSFRLTGIAANEPTSLGCHTDLWCPSKSNFSSMAGKLGWRQKMAPIRSAGDVLGTVSTEIAKETGIGETVPVVCGIHDSNASLVPHLLSREKPFSVVSSGTWVVVMAVGGRPVELDPARDTLINVNAFGEPVPSARFMGGREYELLLGESDLQCVGEGKNFVLENNIMLLPAVENRSGPFQGMKSGWIGVEDERNLTMDQKFAAVCFYLAGMTAVCLDMAGADGESIVEGSFARNGTFCEMLAAATDREVVAVTGTGTSVGAAMLVEQGPRALIGSASTLSPPKRGLRDYAARWRHEALAANSRIQR